MPFRAFIAVDIGARAALVELEDSLRRTGAPLKLVEPVNIHITLKFLDDIDEELIEDIVGVMQESVEGIEPFNIRFNGVGAFPSVNYMKVIWVGMENTAPLAVISGRLNRSLTKFGFKREKRGFRPHVTLARVKGKKHKDRLQNILKSARARDFGELEVKHILLKKSVLAREGPTYSTIAEVELR